MKRAVGCTGPLLMRLTCNRSTPYQDRCGYTTTLYHDIYPRDALQEEVTDIIKVLDNKTLDSYFFIVRFRE